MKITKLSFDSASNDLVLQLEASNKGLSYHLIDELSKQLELRYQIANILEPEMTLRIKVHTTPIQTINQIREILREMILSLQQLKGEIASERMISEQ